MASPFSRTLRSLEADGNRRWMAGLIPALVLLAAWGTWFVCGRVSVYEVTDRAWLAVGREAYPIAAPVAGRVSAVRVVLGQAVQQGQALIELEATEQHARLDEESARRDALSGQIAALRQQIEAGRRALGDQLRASQATIEEARSKAREAEAAARLAQQEADRQARLLADKLVPAAQVERTRSEAEQRRAAADSLTQTLDRLLYGQRSTEGKQRGDIDALDRELALLSGQAGSSEATSRRLADAIGLRAIRAPVAGRIGQIAPVRAGSVVAQGDQLGMVVPDGELMAIAEFSPASALGRIAPRQAARVLLTGFPAVQYGFLTARVARVASEPRNGRIRVELALESHRGSRLPLQHGLPGTVEVEIERISPAVLVLRKVGRVFDRPSLSRPPA